MKSCILFLIGLIFPVLLLNGCSSGDSSLSTPITPSITWSAPAAITYGTALSSTQLNATANDPGTFAYSPASGAILGAGTQTLTATFTPSDPTTIASAAAKNTITVNKATPTITWNTPASISVGTALSSTQLNATASVAGAFVYSPAAGTVINTAGSQTISATFTPTDAADYNSATGSVTIVVNAGSLATPAITWSAPAAIAYGTALSSTQLDATANYPGTFAYSPASGAILGAGTQSLRSHLHPVIRPRLRRQRLKIRLR
jgi:large repetitive protein